MNSRIIQFAAKLWGIFTLLGLGIAIVVSIFSGWGLISEWYSHVFHGLALIAYGIVAWIILKQLGGEAVNTAQQVAVLFAGLLAAFVVVPLAFGYIQDVQGVSCHGIAGAETSCFRRWAILPFMILLGGQIGPVIFLFIIGLAIYGSTKKAKQPKKL